ncbi:MAG TPA: sulfotransferase, partial [Tepidisphaeraceae bacterium]|nr:sulfotransferase [Tepidisphaeraceae bacterium]
LHLELVELLFPQAHVIHCIRDPMDTCLSCYMTDFEVANGFQSELRHVGAYYRQYERLMAHWRRVLRIPILEVRYEEVIADVESQARRMLEFLSLRWDERCVNFHQSRRPVTTASRDQVRRPLYASSVGRWKHYQKHLAELAASL